MKQTSRRDADEPVSVILKNIYIYKCIYAYKILKQVQQKLSMITHVQVEWRWREFFLLIFYPPVPFILNRKHLLLLFF